MRDLRLQAKRRSTGELVEHLKAFELDLKFSAGCGASRLHRAGFMTATSP